MTQPALWQVPPPTPAGDVDEPPPRRRRRWVARCDDCGRRVWAKDSLARGADGRRRGGGCRRKWRRATRRLAVPQRIVVRPPGEIPGQLAIEDPRVPS
ncbi:hypothetical protein [Nonomuraea aridisoli]|uniref:Uncharacterized protein n=1 Tax=Nonomuraea aridisoli TaxID=2070368 RepID=A0A2W2E936_9ACTN|nr:hypothetical protein [Nonomuraea aridisoli]PZG20632.1 hypothetical protein C1J01_09015 [Nonomuraea aridisoli]